MKLTEPQAWALEGIRQGMGSSPAALGQWMLNRPGIEKTQEHPGKRTHKAQALGRLGGTMMERLRKKGLVRVTMRSPYGGWCPSRATITKEGQYALTGYKEKI